MLLGDEEERQWNAEGPLPFNPTPCWVRSASCMSALTFPARLTPGAAKPIVHLPPAIAPLVLTTGLNSETFDARLQQLGATRVWVSNMTSQWFAFWQNVEGLTVAHSPIEIVCSVRPDGLHRAHTNPNIPKESALQKLPHETEDRREGEMEEARAWAEALVAHKPGAVVLSRPIGNAWAALTQIYLPR